MIKEKTSLELRHLTWVVRNHYPANAARFFFCLSNGWRFVWWIVLSRLDFRCSLVSGLLRRRSAGSFSEQRRVIEPKCYPAFEITGGGGGPLRKNCWHLFLSRVEKMENLLFTNCHLVITKVNVLILSFSQENSSYYGSNHRLLRRGVDHSYISL